jgi:ankyrin repeat protein
MNDELHPTKLSHESNESKDLEQPIEIKRIYAVKSKDVKQPLEPQLIHAVEARDPNQRFEPQLIRAVEADDVELIQSLVNDARNNGKLDDNILSVALMRGCEKGKVKASECLLQMGAKPNGTTETTRTRLAPLLRAVNKNHIIVVRLLFEYGATPDIQDRTGRTALMLAALQNHYHILELLLQNGADPNKQDNAGRNVLHILAMDKEVNFGLSLIARLLEVPNISIDGRDELNRTPLHWACSSGRLQLAAMLLTGQGNNRANIDAKDNRGKTSLHFAAVHYGTDIVAMLLKHGASANMKSDGGWTPLHVACEKGFINIVDLLLSLGMEVNARLVNGMSLLHLAAQGGHTTVVKRLLQEQRIEKTSRDNWGRTPFLVAAQSRSNESNTILTLLAHRIDTQDLSKTDTLDACKGFKATIVDFGHFHNENRVQRKTIYELLSTPETSIMPDVRTTFRWIHLPANNIAWLDTLFKKWFIQGGAFNFQALEVLERSLNRQYEERQPFSPNKPASYQIFQLDNSGDEISVVEHQSVPSTVISKPRTREPPFRSHENPNIGTKPVFPSQVSTVSPKGTKRVPTIIPRQQDLEGKGQEDAGKEQGAVKAKKKGGAELEIPRAGPLAMKAPRNVQARTDYERNAPHVIELRQSSSSTRCESIIITFQSYLHFETQSYAYEMQRAIKHAQIRQASISLPRTVDEALINAYLTTEPPALHIRRLLDPSISQTINLGSYGAGQKDRDHGGKEPPEYGDTDSKVFMVDQLWMWVLGSDMIVTAFPQRWKQPRNDPSNVLESIIAHINKRSHSPEGPIKSVSELSTIISTHCSTALSRHKTYGEDFHLRDKFESFIHSATDREIWLAENSKAISAQAYAWLQYRGSDGDHRAKKKPKIDGLRAEVFYANKLLDTRQEEDLITEMRSVKHEMSLVTKLLRDSLPVLPPPFRSSENTEQDRIRKGSFDQANTNKMQIELLADIDTEALRIFNSLKGILELKKKHATAFEAWFARDQAAQSARQIRNMAILATVFLPLSFTTIFLVYNNMDHLVNLLQSELSLLLRQDSMYLLTIVLAILGFTYTTTFYRLKNIWRTRARPWDWGETPRSSVLVGQAETEVSQVDFPSKQPSLSSPNSTPLPRISRLTWTCVSV